jgi:hypothetical protein
MISLWMCSSAWLAGDLVMRLGSITPLCSTDSGVDDDGQCDGGEFKLGTAPVVADAAVERKEPRQPSEAAVE